MTDEERTKFDEDWEEEQKTVYPEWFKAEILAKPYPVGKPGSLCSQDEPCEDMIALD